mmetsp:Transcript_41369/g.74581  ORF Transcript_41369/g.74581 Transcript_41369/m.74581 type:complete len:101 (+) Transcript_41369:210-512(+)
MAGAVMEEDACNTQVVVVDHEEDEELAIDYEEEDSQEDNQNDNQQVDDSLEEVDNILEVEHSLVKDVMTAPHVNPSKEVCSEEAVEDNLVNARAFLLDPL